MNSENCSSNGKSRQCDQPKYERHRTESRNEQTEKRIFHFLLAAWAANPEKARHAGNLSKYSLAQNGAVIVRAAAQRDFS